MLQVAGKVIIEAAKDGLKKGVEKISESLSESKDFKEAFQDGLKEMSKHGLDKLSNILAPQENEILNAAKENLDKIEDKIYQEPESIAENSTELVNEIKSSEENLKILEEKIHNILTEKLNEINENLSGQEYSESLSSEMKNHFEDLKDLLEQIHDIKIALEKLGIDLNSGSDDFDENVEEDSATE